MADREVLTHLQMTSPGDLRPAPTPAAPLRLSSLDRYSPLIRAATLGIGRAHRWPSQQWDDRQWQAYLDRPHLRHWIALLDGPRRARRRRPPPERPAPRRPTPSAPEPADRYARLPDR